MLSRHRSVQFRVLPENKIVEASHGETILQALMRAKIPLDHSCGGNGTCTTCRVIVKKGSESLGGRTELEHEMAIERDFRDDERLGCQTEPTDGLEIEIP